MALLYVRKTEKNRRKEKLILSYYFEIGMYGVSEKKYTI